MAVKSPDQPSGRRFSLPSTRLLNSMFQVELESKMNNEAFMQGKIFIKLVIALYIVTMAGSLAHANVQDQEYPVGIVELPEVNSNSFSSSINRGLNLSEQDRSGFVTHDSKQASENILKYADALNGRGVLRLFQR